MMYLNGSAHIREAILPDGYWRYKMLTWQLKRPFPVHWRNSFRRDKSELALTSKVANFRYAEAVRDVHALSPMPAVSTVR